jgi:hypothetical protein
MLNYSDDGFAVFKVSQAKISEKMLENKSNFGFLWGNTKFERFFECNKKFAVSVFALKLF